MNILITGGAGFIGSNFIRYLIDSDNSLNITNVDLLTYAGNLENLTDIEENKNYNFVKSDIADAQAMNTLFEKNEFELVINFAAESHVDRSIMSAAEFVRTNVVGTQVLLDVARKYGVKRFCQVSTDEVYGSLRTDEPAFTESNPIMPSSPYSASKAGADHLVLAYGHTHKMNVVITRCSNNYGPYQFPEKFIPLFTTNALADQKLPLYGDGKNVRDWIHVLDHCKGVWKVAMEGKTGKVYNLGGGNEWANIDIAKEILKAVGKDESLIELVKDRPGHDRRYAMDYSLAEKELGWRPEYNFEQGLLETVSWYQDNKQWWESVKDGSYREYYNKQYAN